MKPVSKPCIFVTSLGRTATQFFGQRMSQMIAGCYSVHEPDLLSLDEPHQWYQKIKRFGLVRMTVGKLTTRYSLRLINVARQVGTLPDAQAVAYLRELRGDMVAKVTADIYLEANWQYRGLVDLLPLAFPNCRVIYIIRDPRSWVRSWMNKVSSYYSWRDYISWFKNGRLTPYHFPDDPYQEAWRHMTQFERLCWVWARENSYALACVQKTEAARVFRFEDLFGEQESHITFPQLLDFVTHFPNGWRAAWVLQPALLTQKLHATRRDTFPHWRQWTQAQAQQLDRHCRGLMDTFHYGQEPEWQRKINRT